MRSWMRSHRFKPSGPGAYALILGTLITFSAPAAAVDDDLSFLTAVLRNPAVADSTRTDAALRLLRLGGSGANELLAEALQSSDAAQVEAVARALAGNGVPPRLVADALMASLVDASPEYGALSGRTLARLGENEIPSILLLIKDPEATSATRIACTRALGAFQFRASVEALVELLSTDDPTQLAATTRSLQEITRIDLGDDRARWRSWWEAVGSMPLDQAIGAADSSDQVRQLEAQREAIVKLESRLDELGLRLQLVLGDWFLTVPEADRGPQLRLMLADQLSVIRLFAGNQVQRLLRNGVIPDEETVSAVVALLDDEVGELRILGAQLLGAMGVDGLPERLARSVSRELDDQVASVMLDQIALRPSPEAFEPVLARLDDPMTGPAAARALARMVDASMVPDEWTLRARPSIRMLRQRIITPATAALFVLVGEEEDLVLAQSDLDHESAAVRRSSAYAFVMRERFQPVIDRAEDEGVRPAAIKALGLMPSTTEHLQRLLSIQSDDSQLPEWRDSVRRLAVGFSELRVLSVDDLLAQDDRVPTQLRCDLLDAALSASGSGADAEGNRRVLLERFTLLLSEDNRWQEVAKTLGQPGVVLDGILPDRLFTARMQLEDFEGAAAVHDSPNVWLEFLDRNLEGAPAGAAAIVEEIRVRFADQLDETQKARLDTISRKIALVDGSITELDVD
jgi:hypothetical protein